MSTARRATGYKPSKKKGPHISTMRGFKADAPLPDAVSLVQFAGPVADQGQTSSCVGQAVARAIFIRQAVAGTPCAFPSPAWIYAMARVLERGPTPVGTVPQPLQDDGCAPDEAIAAASTALGWGAASGTAYPFNPDTINDEPSLEGAELGLCCVINAHYSIPTDAAAEQLVMQSLAHGYPIVRGGPCGDETQKYPGGDAVIGSVVNPESGHETCIVGYDHNGPGGSLRFIEMNSWGLEWGNAGFGWTNSNWLADSQDLDAIEASTVREPS